MVLVKFALRNPYAIWAVAIGLCLLGLAVIPSIPADILPDFKKPVVVSFFSYPGLPTGEMEKSVTSRVERALTLAGRIEHQESRTLPGASVIKIFFQSGADASSAMNDIVNLIASDMFHLPPGMEHPFTLRSEPANLPVVLAAIHGEGLSETELYKIGYYAVRNKMGGLKGVQIPHPFGGKFRQMMVYVDPQKLHSLQLAPIDVVNALKEANLVMAGGTMKLGQTEYQIHPVNTLLTTEDIDNVPIAIRNGRPVFIRDVGYAKDDAALQYNIVRVNGNRSVYCPLLREPGENTIAVVDRIRKGLAEEIPRMKDRGDIPRATEVTLVNDQSSYIRNAIRNLEYQVLLGALLVALVIALFLRKFMASLAVLLVMPLAIVIGMLGFYFTGNTINVMTLGGIALAIGTVVDAGIVVVVNIMRHLNMGKGAAEAADEATTEVAAPVLAGIVTTLAIFIPAIFLTGMVKYLFTPLALAATMTIGASYLVAMTIVPAFCSRMIWVDPKTGIDFFIGVQYENNEMESLDDLRNLPLSMEGPNGPVTIPLSNVAEIKRVNIHGEIAHYNIARVNDVYVNVSGRDMGSVVTDVEKAIAEMDKELGVSVNIRGPVVTMRTGSGALRWGLVVAAILVYLVMMAQFRSIIDPLIIMLAVPLGLSGVFVMLYLTGTTLNIQSLMGTLMMVGVVVNNSILLVDFANRLRDRGYEPSRAALVAAGTRLRPILMTALTLVVSMLPLSIRLAPGSDAMIPLARALIGGMLVSTFLTLFLVPCVYSVVKSKIGPSAG